MNNHNLKDIVGKRFGRLTVLHRAENSKRGQARWACSCACGGSTVVVGSSLRRGTTSSCGCLRKEITAKQGRKALRHGHRAGRETAEYKTWRGLVDRCRNPRHKQFKDYGGRGITVCERWKKFENFLEDMGRKPFPRATIDRIDNNKGYSPVNCRWATFTQQNRNRRSTRYLTYNGETRCMKEWAEEYGINYGTFKWRIYQGWSMKRALGLGLSSVDRAVSGTTRGC
jgi:hypothetical protein